MIKAVFFDLDDTLLGNDMATFLPPYFQAMVARFPELPPERVLRGVQAATQAAIHNTDPMRTLDAVLGECLSAQLDLPRSVWQPRFDALYAEDFPQLRALVTPRPEAAAFVHWALSHELKVVIATNAIFPRVAITQRLAWAGLGELPLAWVTSLETSHFAKPNPAYYGEILAELGLGPDEALMVGNDWSQDIVPADAVGLATWWVSTTPAKQPVPRLLGSGNLEAALTWARQQVTHVHDSATQVIRPVGDGHESGWPYRLAGNLARIAAVTAEARPESWRRQPAPGEWSLGEVLCHLRDVEREVHQPRLRATLKEDNPFLAGADTDQWAVARDYAAQDGPAALTDFAQARRETVLLLSQLPAIAWSRPARHALLGPTTLAELARVIVDHDQIHLAQSRALMK
jgi:FMN phosphatase YigB (HAD superfamily)